MSTRIIYAAIADLSLRHIRFREKWGLTVLALRRGKNSIRHAVSGLLLRLGDALPVEGPGRRIKIPHGGQDFNLLEEQEAAEVIKRPEKEFTDFAGVGILLTLIVFALAVTLVPSMWPF
jgi:hypothetical protein